MIQITDNGTFLIASLKRLNHRLVPAQRHFKVGAAAQGLIGAVLLLTGSFATADWQLDTAASSLSFVSVKNGQIAEAHRFDAMQGRVDATGEALLSIDLDSVETNIPIRNERLRGMLFHTGKYPAATINASVPMDQLQALEPGASMPMPLEAQIALHGVSMKTTAQVQVTRIGDEAWQVVSSAPLIIRAADFNLLEGIDALREIAGLTSITTAVPVTFNLVFRAAE